MCYTMRICIACLQLITLLVLVLTPCCSMQKFSLFIYVESHNTCTFYLTRTSVSHKGRMTTWISQRLHQGSVYYLGAFLHVRLLLFLCYFCIVLLLSNDVHPNPGPNQPCISFEAYQEIHTSFEDRRKFLHLNFQNMRSKPDLYREFVTELNDLNTTFGFSET